MDLKISFDIPSPPQKIQPGENILLTGSCFSENIGACLQRVKFSILTNPNGVIYNPVSILDSIQSYIDDKEMNQNALFEYNGLWHSWEHHGSFSNADKKDILGHINRTIHTSHQFLKRTGWLMITLGSAYVYSLKDTGKIVANCHKFPQKNFDKRLLSVEEIRNRFLAVYKEVKEFNPLINILITVSPVRHLRDGLVENNLSKSILLLAANEIKNACKDVYYFPAYEIVMDELRDYRFFDRDYAHPNELAIAYVWERFINCMVDGSNQSVLKEIEQIADAYEHKILHPGTVEHKRFLKTYYDKTVEFSKRYPEMNFEKELKYFSAY